MERTIDFIGRLRAKHDGCSDYRLAKLLEVGSPTLVKYTKHGGSMSDKVAIRMAKLVDKDPAYVLSCVKAEKCNDAEAVKVWERIGANFAASTMFAIPLIMLVFQEIERGV